MCSAISNTVVVKRGRRHRNPDTREPSSQTPRGGDDAGCLLIIFSILWWAGIISFNSCSESRARQQLEDVQANVEKAEEHLVELTTVTRQLRSDLDSLSSHREDLERQVTTLERTRDAIAAKLGEAIRVVAPSRQGRLHALAETLFTGILGNVISYPLILGIGWILGARSRKRKLRAADNGAA